MREFTERLKILRKRENMSIRELSEAVGLSIASISDWENGKNDIMSDNLLALAKFFECTTDYLLGND